MLTSKWWMGYVDPDSKRYNDVSEKKRATLMSEVQNMYKQIDTIVGKNLDHIDERTILVFSSDHGVIPLNTSVKINNLFAKKGWIKYDIDSTTGVPSIDWINSKVVFLKMSNVYVNPEGLGPVWKRGKGLAYEKLRNEVIEQLVYSQSGDTLFWEKPPENFYYQKVQEEITETNNKFISRKSPSFTVFYITFKYNILNNKKCVLRISIIF